MTQRNSTQKGNVLFIILIAVALLSGLTFVMSSGRTSTSIDPEKTLMELNEILQYGNKIESAIGTMMANGCDSSQISFYTTEWPVDDAEWINAASPANNSCHVFDNAGGGIRYQVPPPATTAAVAAEPNPTLVGVYFFTGILSIFEVGTTYVWGNGVDPATASELLMVTRVPREMCILANSKAGVSNPGGAPPTWPYGAIAGWAFEKFNGFNACCTIGDPAQAAPTGEEVRGKYMGCYQSTDNAGYYLYKVLLAR